MLCLIFIIIPTVSLQVVQSLFYNNSRTDHGSCRFRSVRQAEFNSHSPEQSMTESFVLDDIEYKLCRYRVTWDEALVFCSSHQAHLATIDTEEKTAVVIEAIASINSVSEEFWIGAKQMYEEPWKWILNKKALSFEEDIISKIPVWYPGFEPNNIHCLTIDRSGHNEPIFVPRSCNQRRGFICQRDNDRAFDNKIRMVAATLIGEQEFRLYAGKTTWAEAVVHCRQEGLQIGEVNTVQEARALAISMLRNRPEGIESVWIGGYTRSDDENTWHWLASGEKIENNGMWRKDLSESSGSCLLLDRHVCESPVYVGSSCDRKRDVLCQKPPKKLLSKKPVSVIVDDCPYWVGFYPLKWSDARRACESLNASLIVLDSPATISHMMSLMLDNKAELRHIWTNGRRSKTDGQWIWDSTGEAIPDFEKSFIPWCPDDDYYTKENSCLNMDREKLDSPLVYGLSCREKQTYVCQPYVGDCVFHSTPKLPLDAMINASEDIEKKTTFEYLSTLNKYMATLTTSTITTPFAILNLNDDVLETTFHSKNNHLSDLTTWKSSESIVEKNSSSQRNFAQYLEPFTRFTLPSLPQFGIKVVSATEAAINLPSIDINKKKNKAYKLLSTFSDASATTHLPPSSSLSTSVKKGQSNGHKASTDKAKVINPSNFDVTTISSVSTEIIIEKSSKNLNTNRPAFTQISSSLQAFLGSKNSSKSSKVSKHSTTSSSLVSDDLSGPLSSELEKTKKYSMKTTRDLNSPDTATTKAPEVENPTNGQTRTSNSKEIQNLSPKSIDSYVLKKTRPDSIFVARKRLNTRITTEAPTPYDAIDMEYYNDDKYVKGTNKGVEENAEKSGESIEYSKDYESISRAKFLTNKKSKHTSTARLGKNLPFSPKADEEEEEKKESIEEDEDTVKSSLPIATELSKNLESALVNMMKSGIEKKNSKKLGELSRSMKMTEPINTGNAAWLKEDNYGSGSKSMNVEHITLRPYYAFEGPMIADLSEITGRDRSERGDQEFEFIGRNWKPGGFQAFKNTQYPSKNDLSKLQNNETQRHPITQPSNPQNHQGNFPISMMGMPPIHLNDPNSMMQLGRYIKNQFSGLQHGSDRDVEDRKPQMTNPNKDIEGYGQRRFRPMERPFLQERLGGYPVNREKVIMSKVQQSNSPLKKPGFSGLDTNYYADRRRLYPRGNYDMHRSLPEPESRNNEERLKNVRKQLDIPWPDKYVANYEDFHQDNPPVSPRSASAPIRTTRSFHEDTETRKIKVIEQKPLPDFKLSKLVKEVKIDMDQRMLRRYLEGFSKKIGRKSSGSKDGDWKDTWRQLLRQMLSVMNRMNVNFNGNLMKLRVGDDDINNKFNYSGGNSRGMTFKSGLIENGKQLKDSVSKNYANLGKKMNKTLQTNNVVGSRQKPMRVPLNNFQVKNLAKVNTKPQIKGKNTNSYRKIADDRGTSTRSSLEKKKIEVTTFSELQFNRNKFGDKLSGHRQERTDKPNVDHREKSNQMPNVSNPRNTKSNNTPIVRRPVSIIPEARVSTAFDTRPSMPHKIIFQPGWSQIHANSGPQKTVVKSEHLPEGILSKMINSQKKNDHFEGDKNEARKPEHIFLVSTSSTTKPEKITFEQGLKNSSKNETFDEQKMHEDKSNLRSEVATMSETSENDFKTREKSNQVDNLRDKVSRTDNNDNEAWIDGPEEIGRNKLRNEDLDEYYNATYVKEFIDRKIDDNMGGNARDVEEEIMDEETESPENYESKPIWTPAHRLNKAMELSILRQLAANPSSSLRLKNLVTRSVKEIETIRSADDPETANRNNGYTQEQKIEQSLENLNEEPSIISLRMIMNPLRKPSRILRQSQDRRSPENTPRTVELRVQFSGTEEPTKAITERIYSRNYLTQNEKTKKSLNGSVLADSGGNVKGKNLKSPVAFDLPLRFIDKDRQRAMLNRLREQNRNLKRNYLIAAAKRRQNATAKSNLRDRKYGNIGLETKNALSEIKTIDKFPNAKHYIVTSLKSFDEKNLTNSAENFWKKGGNHLGINWTEQASALLADLKESNDDLTLYIDLTLGRVGSKPRMGRRSKG